MKTLIQLKQCKYLSTPVTDEDFIDICINLLYVVKATKWNYLFKNKAGDLISLPGVKLWVRTGTDELEVIHAQGALAALASLASAVGFDPATVLEQDTDQAVVIAQAERDAEPDI